jgi:hypothetical protein
VSEMGAVIAPFTALRPGSSSPTIVVLTIRRCNQPEMTPLSRFTPLSMNTFGGIRSGQGIAVETFLTLQAALSSTRPVLVKHDP